MTRRMDQKVAIITGSASGIGRATAILFAQEGASVVVADVNDDGGAETVRQIADAKGTAIFLHTDVTKPEQVDRLIKQTVSRYGRLDALARAIPVLASDESSFMTGQIMVVDGGRCIS